MARFLRRTKGMSGSKPGTLIHVGEKKVEKVFFHVMQFDADGLVEEEVQSIDDALSMISDGRMTWINIIGLHDMDAISSLGTHLSLDNLLLEDILNTEHRPKYIFMEDMLCFIVKLLNIDDTGKINADQMSIIAAENCLITLQEQRGRHFDPIRDRIRQTRKRQRVIYADYLAYAILDCVVDVYMDIATEIGDLVDGLENEIMNAPDKDTSAKIYRHRTELNYLRKVILPTRELTLNFLKSESQLVREDTRSFITDLNDHIIITQEVIDTYYTIVADLREIYHSSLSNRSNEIMQVLTVFAAFFIPLTFMVGIYGMNFKNMPELNWDYGYLFFWVLIIAVSLSLTYYFKKKKWF